MLILFIVLTTLFFIISVIMIYKYVQLAKIVLNVEDTIEVCLDIIDKKYAIMTEILNRPLFLDSYEVRSVVQEIKSVRDSLHNIAFSLNENIYSGENDDTRDESS